MKIIKARAFLFLFFLSTSPFSQPHVVFEEVGQMVGSVSYMHCTLTLDLGFIEELLINATLAVKSYSDLIEVIYAVNPSLNEQQERDKLNYHRISWEFEGWLNDLATQVTSIRHTLPAPSNERVKRAAFLAPVLLKAAKALGKTVIRKIKVPQLSFSLANGVFGTFMGLYSASQLEKLRTELGSVKAQQDRLVIVITEHQLAIERLANDTVTIKQHISTMTFVNPPYMVAKLTRMIDRIRTTVHTAIHVIQQAQHKRLAVDYLPAGQLAELYEELTTAASQQKYTLLTGHPSDLFQLELSYLYDGKNVILLLHVPMVPQRSTLRLFRLRPFPIPFSSSRALLPKPSPTVLALSSSIPRSISMVELADLVDCHQVNNVFICERHGILHKNIKAYCLGALYEQDIESAREVCDLELVPYQEYALQLDIDWFLVYSPKLFTAPVTCHNGSISEVDIKAGVNKFSISPGCSCDLINTTLISETNLKFDSNIKHFEWARTEVSQFGVQDDDIDLAIQDMEGIAADHELLLSEVVTHQRLSARIPSKRIMLILVTAIGSIGIIVFLVMMVGTHRFVKIRTKLRRVRAAVEGVLPRRPQAPPDRPLANLPQDLRELLGEQRHQ